MPAIDPNKPVRLTNAPTLPVRLVGIRRVTADTRHIIGAVTTGNAQPVEDVHYWTVNGAAVGHARGPIENVLVTKWKWALRNASGKEWVTLTHESEEDIAAHAAERGLTVIGRIKETQKEE
jgi:hypothetical protein